VDDARVNANGQRLIVGMAGEIALKMDSDLSRHPFNPSIYRKSVKIC